jgi:DNA-directed RNA polymerase subunit F
LFTNPQQYLAAQDASMQQQFARNAEMAPLNRARMLYQQAGYQAGQGIGGALGGTDPQLDLISKRNVLLSQLNPNDPASYIKVAQVAAQIGDQQFAMAIAQEGRKAQSEMALTTQRTAEKMTNEQRNALAYASQFGTPDSQEFKDAYKERFDQLTLKARQEKTPDKIQIAERIAESKGFVRGTPEFSAEVAKQLEQTDKETIPQIAQLQKYRDTLITSNAPASKIAEVNAIIKSLGEGNAPKIVLPGQPVEPKDWLKFSEFISKDPVMDRTSTIISDAPTAIETIRTSTQNSFSAASLPAAIAKLTGEGKNMSNQDIARYARTGGLTDRLSQDVVGFFTGKKTDVTKAQAEQFAVALYRGALIERKKFIEDQAAQLGYDKSPNYQTTIGQLDKKLSQFSLVNPQGGKTPVPTAKSSDDDLINKYLKPKP